MANNNAIQKGLQAAKQAAREEGMAGKVQELSNNLQANASGEVNAGGIAGAGAGFNADATDVAALGNNAGADNDAAEAASIAPADGFRYDYDDDSNV
jgi:hypothetical protein